MCLPTFCVCELHHGFWSFAITGFAPFVWKCFFFFFSLNQSQNPWFCIKVISCCFSQEGLYSRKSVILCFYHFCLPSSHQCLGCHPADMMGATSSRNSMKELTLIWKPFWKPGGSWYVIFQLPKNLLHQVNADGDQIIGSWLSTESISYTAILPMLFFCCARSLLFFTPNESNVLISRGYIFPFANSSFHPLHF